MSSNNIVNYRVRSDLTRKYILIVTRDPGLGPEGWSYLGPFASLGEAKEFQAVLEARDPSTTIIGGSGLQTFDAWMRDKDQ